MTSYLAPAPAPRQLDIIADTVLCAGRQNRTDLSTTGNPKNRTDLSTIAKIENRTDLSTERAKRIGTAALIDLRTKQGWEDLKRILDDRVSDVFAMCGLEAPRRQGWTLIDDPRGDGRECFGFACAPTAWRGKNSTAPKRAGRWS
jgi:hypothetical protein